MLMITFSCATHGTRTFQPFQNSGLMFGQIKVYFLLFVIPLILCYIHDLCILGVFVFIHNNGELLLGASRNEIQELQQNENFDMHVHISVLKTTTTLFYECNEKALTYDECVLKTALKKLENKCVPAFLELNEIPPSLRTCTNYTESVKALDILQSLPVNCLETCTKIKVKITGTPVDKLYAAINIVPVTYSAPAYYFSMPIEIVVSEVKESYSFISYVADVGGWVGLLLGLSLVGFGQFLMKFLGIPNRLVTTTLRFLLCIGSIAVGVIACYCCLKLAYRQISSNISIEPNLQNVSLSLCSLESVYSWKKNKAPQDFYPYQYIGNTSSFWNDNTQLHHKIRKIKIKMKSGKMNMIYDDKKKLTSDFLTQSTNIPVRESFIESCHTFVIKDDIEIEKIEITAKKELVCYVHVSGQLLHPDSRQGFSIANPSFIEKSGREVELYTSSTFFNMKLINLKEVLTHSFPVKSTYDDCILSLISHEENVSLNMLNPKKEIEYTHGLEEISFQRIEKILFSKKFSSKCEHPEYRSETSYIQEQGTTKWKTKQNQDVLINPSQGKAQHFCNFLVLV